MARPREDVQERFWSFVHKTNGCWNWTGSNVRGYGKFMIEKKNLSAHRLSYEFHIGKIPSGHLVCHKCDNPSCVNPDHLFLGTWKSNVDDMIQKGRRRDSKGTKNGKSKLTEKDILKIRKLYSKNDTTISKYSKNQKYSTRWISQKYGVSQSLISGIVQGKRWSHV
jgi:hypothetical protein